MEPVKPIYTMPVQQMPVQQMPVMYEKPCAPCPKPFAVAPFVAPMVQSYPHHHHHKHHMYPVAKAPCSSVGEILVLFILLVIISRAILRF